MEKKYSLIFFLIFIFALSLGGFFYFRNQVYYFHGSENTSKIFKISKGEGNMQIAENLKKEGLISGKLYFYYYFKINNLLNKIYPGEYLLRKNMTIPEIAVIITNPQKTFITVTFPEGWTAEQMSARLSASGFDGNSFQKLVNNPTEDILSQFLFLKDRPANATLEGYLFPDTYKFAKEATPEGILRKILSNTELKLSESIRTESAKQRKAIFQVLTMASILEREVSTEADFKIVAGIFWNRIAIGQALQSDATLEYVLKTNDFQHSIEQTQTDSPYNTYKYKGLPPGPIGNPGIAAIAAALNPTITDYNYFLTDPNNLKNTVYSKTFEEHVANKLKYGL